MLIDSTVDPRSSPLFMLYSIAERGDDESLFFSHVHYKDLKDAMDQAGSAEKSGSANEMLPAEFVQQRLNQWTSGQSSLFPPNVLDKYKDKYHFDCQSIAGNAAYIVGAGPDRAYGFSVHGDATVTTAVLKTLVGEDDHYFVLASDKISFSSAADIRKAFTHYKSQDIAAWWDDQSFEHEIVTPLPTSKPTPLQPFITRHRRQASHSPSIEKLMAEMGTLEYRIVNNSTGKGGQ